MNRLTRLIPVLDLKGGVVVRGVGGRRDEYRPVVSRLARSCEPAAVAAALVEASAARDVYVADLDAIAGMPPAFHHYHSIRRAGVPVWVDAGVRRPEQAVALTDAGVDLVVAGLETLAGAAALADVVTAIGPDRVVFSLDLRDGRPLGGGVGWRSRDPAGIVAEAVDHGVRRVIVLDLARVGLGGGVGTEEVCRRVASAHRGVELIAGGGLRGPEDLARLARLGVAGALVASALHDGTIGPGHVGRPAKG